jgi:serine/threonine protein kinase
MLALLECVGQAVVNKGVHGLAEFVPGGPYILEVVGEAYRLFRERRRNDDLRAELEKAATAGAEEAKRAAEEIARKVAGESSVADRLTLELYLTQVPGSIRQSLKRAEDPSGKSVPADFILNDAADLARVLPHRVPHFRPGADLPGRSGWKLDELLGSGGFGEVWLARHTLIPNARAVKFCTDPVAKAKLTSHEGKVIARVMAHGHHPNVVPLLDAALEGDAPWLMYEYVGGGNLIDLVHQWQRLAPADREKAVVAALHELATAVGSFHRLTPPIVHRDLKPSNILVDGARVGQGENAIASASLAPRRLRITDFGIGGVAVEDLRAHHPTGASLMTGWLETSLRGSYTPLYASPQQRAGAAPGPRDDVHALGVIGYQLATGHLHQAPGMDAAEDLRDSGIGDGLIQLITRCVSQKPERRPKDAGDLAERLAELLRIVGPISPPKLPDAATETLRAGLAPPGGVKRKPGTPTKPSPAAFPGGKMVDRPPIHDDLVPALKPIPPSPKPARGPETPRTAQPSKWLIPFRAIWFSRPIANSDAPWDAQPGRLPGEVIVKPGEAYRLAFPADDTDDATVAKIRLLSPIPNLEAVDLSGCAKVTDAGLSHLAAIPGLRAIGLAETAVTDSGVALLLKRFPQLEALGLAGAENVSHAVLADLVQSRRLKVISLPPWADTIDVRSELKRRLPGCVVV